MGCLAATLMDMRIFLSVFFYRVKHWFVKEMDSLVILLLIGSSSVILNGAT